MAILVSDTSVLIDLERCDLLNNAFNLEAEFVVPDLLFERELRNYGGEDLLALGLQVASLPPDGVEQAQSYVRRQSRLTVPDSFALALAKRNGWTLLSGDGLVRALAQEEQVVCHGVLWLLDQMEHGEAATAAQLNAGLRRLSIHPRCRLQAAEITVRLERYAILIQG